jgi:hypothetical protein
MLNTRYQTNGTGRDSYIAETQQSQRAMEMARMRAQNSFWPLTPARVKPMDFNVVTNALSPTRSNSPSPTNGRDAVPSSVVRGYAPTNRRVSALTCNATVVKSGSLGSPLRVRESTSHSSYQSPNRMPSPGTLRFPELSPVRRGPGYSGHIPSDGTPY